MKATRSSWQGVMTIARLNWPYYLVALAVLTGASCGLVVLPAVGAKILAGLAVAGAAYFLLGSLGVSHLVYDRSDLYRWKWLDRALHGLPVRQAVICHTGFDESSQRLREKFPEARWQVLDHFDEARMTEASIRRARKAYPPTPGTWPASFDDWPLDSRSADVVVALLAIHELRSIDERRAWFREARRCLRPSGRIVIVEHLRDLANALAFGPGFLHFHSRESWQESWEHAGLHCQDEFPVTPWVRVFVITPAS